MTPKPLLLSLFVLAAFAPAAVADNGSHLVLLGTYTTAGSRGIYEARLDGETGALTDPVLAAETPNPSFLALSPDHRFLYAHADVGRLPDGRAAGGIRSFAFDPQSGRLTFLNAVATGDPFPSNVAIDGTGRLVSTVSGTGGHITTFHVEDDGSLSPPVSHLALQGTPGPVKDRQGSPYPHSTNFSPDNRFALICDLGTDRIVTFRFDPATGALSPESPPFCQLPRGTGPRHAKFSSDGRFFYCSGELSNTVTAFRYQASTGRVEPIQRLSTVPAGVGDSNRGGKPESLASEIRLRADGRFAYVANRGDDSLAVFARDAGSGLLTPVEIVKCGGKTPRNFNLTPDGRWLLCAHQDSPELTVFRVDPDSGRLTAVPGRAKISRCICVLFVD